MTPTERAEVRKRQRGVRARSIQVYRLPKYELEQVAPLMNMTFERVRQIEVKAMAVVRPLLEAFAEAP